VKGMGKGWDGDGGEIRWAERAPEEQRRKGRRKRSESRKGEVMRAREGEKRGEAQQTSSEGGG